METRFAGVLLEYGSASLANLDDDGWFALLR
jgi:hypothetical protein